jgi:uncharacterized repeat protein (TIGR03803 family)
MWGGKHADGTVFSITPSGTENVVYSFAGGSDGLLPRSDLINMKGTLYGTTEAGGSGGFGNGTVFSVTLSGAENVLYTFTGEPDGAEPLSGLVSVNGTLYGTTYQGGTSNNGTVFSITP